MDEFKDAIGAHVKAALAQNNEEALAELACVAEGLGPPAWQAAE